MILLLTLIFANLFLVICELFLPGGILGLVALSAGSYAVWHSYQLFGGIPAILLGLGLLLSNLYLIVCGLKYWSQSRLATGFMLKTSLTQGPSSPKPEVPLLGHRGESMTVFNPSGKVLIANQIYDAYSQNGYIDQGVCIEVTARNNFGLIIKKL